MATGGGLATAFYRLYILHALERAPARPAAVLAALHAREGPLPFEGGAFSRALQQLLDAGLLIAGPSGTVQLTPMGGRERAAQRAVWERLVAIVARLLAGELPSPEPPADGGVPMTLAPPERVAEGYRERVVIAEVREAARRGRDSGEAFAVVLAQLCVAHREPLRARAMVQRALRETLSACRSMFGPRAVALRYGMDGAALIVPSADADAQAELLRARLAESLAAMSATVRAFAGARHGVRVGLARWSPAVLTSAQLLRLAEEALDADARGSSAA